MTHALKTWPKYFEDVLSGDKTFEVRRFDRQFKVGDILLLQEWDNKTEQYTGRETSKVVTYILSGGTIGFGVMPNYCVMSLGDLF